MHTLRAIKWFLAIGWFVLLVLLLTACSFRDAPAVATDQTVHIPLGTTFLTPQSASSVFTVAWSPDGKHLALGEADGSVQVRNSTTGSILYTVQGHMNHVWSLAWSPDGKRLASASWDRTVQVWDANTGAHQLTYPGQTDLVLAVAWSPDGTRIATAGSDNTVQVWNANSCERI